MAGPAIRAAHIARVLAEHHDVTLASLAGPGTSPVDGRPVAGPEVISVDFDAAIVQGRVTVSHPELLESELPLAVDWFDPFHVEALHRGGDDRILRIDLAEGARSTLMAQARRGDFFLCSNTAQREHWLGWLAAAGRLNVETHAQDPLFTALLAMAPFGVSSSEIRATPEGHKQRFGRSGPLHKTFPIIDPHDPVLLWAGGLHDWLDPMIFIKAMPRILEANPDTRLVFLAGPHPNTSIEHMGVRGDAISLAREMRLFGTSVLFVNQWVDYWERLAWLRNATIGVVADRAHLESRYSHRTRLLDHLAAGLPTVSTDGDPLSAELVDVGAATTTARDPESIGAEIAALVNDEDRLDQMSLAASRHAIEVTWEDTLRPLLDWLDVPSTAADRASGLRLTEAEQATALDDLTRRVRLHLDDGGPMQVAQRGVGALRRRLGR